MNVKMNEYKLLRTHKNVVLDLIKSMSLNPFNFSWNKNESVNIPNTIVPILNYNDSEYYFQFDYLRSKPYSAFSPGKNALNETSNSRSWAAQQRDLRIWLTCLRREVNEPDLWIELEKYRVVEDQDLLTNFENDPFTANQAEQIQAGLLKAGSYLEKFTIDNTEHQQFVNKQLEYLADAAKRQGKKDWLHTCIGVIITITTALALAPEEAKNIWVIIKTALSDILQLPH